MEKILKIDIHAHATWYKGLIPPALGSGLPFLSGDELIAKYDQLGIEKGVLLPIISPEGMTVTMTNENCLMIAREYPDRYFWFCNVDPRGMNNSTKANLGYLLEYYKNLGARGVGEMSSNNPIDDPKMENLFRYCEELEMPVLFHLSPAVGYSYGMVDDFNLPKLEGALKKFPKLKFIGHSQTFWSQMSGDLREEDRNGYPRGKVTPGGRITELLRNYDNLYCDLSAGSGGNALMRDPEHAASFLTEFQDRIMYGCDICADSNTHPFVFRDFFDAFAESGAISETVYRKVSRCNALKLLGCEE